MPKPSFTLFLGMIGTLIPFSGSLRAESAVDARAQIPATMSEAFKALPTYHDPRAIWCSARSDLWAEELIQRNLSVKKLIIFYAKNSPVIPNSWAFHVAPVVEFEGARYVFDKGSEFAEPTDPSQWMLHHTGQICAPARPEDQELANAFLHMEGGSLTFIRDLMIGTQCRFVEVDAAISQPDARFYDFFFSGIQAPGISREALREACAYVIGEPIVRRERAAGVVLNEKAMKRARARCEPIIARLRPN